MRNRLLLCFSLIALTVRPAGAAGINLGWNDCPGGATYTHAQTFACDTNLGTHTLVGSFVAPASVLKMSGNEIVIDMVTSGTTLSPWWTMTPGLCRSGSLTSSFDFTTGPFTCFDYWEVAASGFHQMSTPVANAVRIKGLVAIRNGDSHITSIAEGTEVYSFRFIINNNRTVGLGSCGGCGSEACIVLNSIKLYQPNGTPGGNILLTNPATSQYVIWQAWSDANNQCPAVTPARRETWGSIKSLYR